MDEEFEEWLKEDWFTSGEKSWEEYWNEDETMGATCQNIIKNQQKKLLKAVSRQLAKKKQN